VLLTNGALFSQKDVRDQACLANTVKASLSAFDQASFEAVNRPDSAIDFAGLVEGLKTFGREYQGEYRLEVFVIPGVNAEDEQLRRIAAFAREIQPSRVQLNCAVRPAAESYVDGVSQQRLLEIATLFDPPAEVIPDFSGVQQIHEATTEAIYNVICRRPCTAMELANVFGCHINEIGKHLGKLGYEERIRSFRQGKSIYFAPVGRSLADHS
jgi:wyosine [tRNA(Phe)-imidazoG37] synthetase (radical SAM superfamily)